MKQRLTKDYGSYGQRWQVETGISMLKRRVGSVVQARSYWAQCHELLGMALTYNFMLLYAAAGFLQSNSRPLFPPTQPRAALRLPWAIFCHPSGWKLTIPSATPKNPANPRPAARSGRVTAVPASAIASALSPHQSPWPR